LHDLSTFICNLHSQNQFIARTIERIGAKHKEKVLEKQYEEFQGGRTMRRESALQKRGIQCTPKDEGKNTDIWRDMKNSPW